MKKIFSLMILFIVVSAYMSSESDEEYSGTSTLSYNIEQTVFNPVKNVSTSIYNGLVTDDFKGCVRLAVDNTFSAAKILFLNVIDTVISSVSDMGSYLKAEYNKSIYTEN